MPKFDKYVNALFIGAAAVLWLVSSHYVGYWIAYFQLGRRIGEGADVLGHVLPIALGLALFLGLKRSYRSVNFTTDAVSELVKVHWPGKKEVRFGTIVVIITVSIAGTMLGLFDMGFSVVVRTLIGA